MMQNQPRSLRRSSVAACSSRTEKNMGKKNGISISREPRRLSLQGLTNSHYLSRITDDKATGVVAENSAESADLTAYYAFSRRRGNSIVHDETGFLEYRKLDGSWRPFLFQTIDYQLPTHQVTVMSTDIRNASEISIAPSDNNKGESRILRLGINGTVITLRAVSHNAAMYWVEGLQQLKEGKKLQITSDRPTIESEDDIFQQIDHLTHLREWTPPPPNAQFCGFC